MLRVIESVLHCSLWEELVYCHVWSCGERPQQEQNWSGRSSVQEALIYCYHYYVIYTDNIGHQSIYWTKQMVLNKYIMKYNCLSAVLSVSPTL